MSFFCDFWVASKLVPFSLYRMIGINYMRYLILDIKFVHNNRVALKESDNLGLNVFYFCDFFNFFLLKRKFVRPVCGLGHFDNVR